MKIYNRFKQEEFPIIGYVQYCPEQVKPVQLKKGTLKIPGYSGKELENDFSPWLHQSYEEAACNSIDLIWLGKSGKIYDIEYFESINGQYYKLSIGPFITPNYCDLWVVGHHSMRNNVLPGCWNCNIYFGKIDILFTGNNEFVTNEPFASMLVIPRCFNNLVIRSEIEIKDENYNTVARKNRHE